MSLSGWLIAAAIFIIILLIALGVGWWLRNNSHPAPAPPNAYIAPLGWGQQTQGPNFPQNTCLLYEFPTAEVELGTGTVFMPGTPTFNPNILNGMSGSPDFTVVCLDPDQILAQQVQHTCTAPLGVVNEQITRCILINGGTTGLGGNEIYYSDSACPAIPACPGELSVISLNFQAPTTPIYCIQNNGTGANVTMVPCDPASSNQLFRVTRTNPGQNPDTLQPSQAQNGFLTQILDRETGLCVVPGTGSSITVFNPNSVTGCSGSSQSISGTNIILGSCTGGEFPGYVWALLPTVPFCSNPSGCTACSGCVGCQQLPQTNTCGGCTGCVGSPILGIPQQVVYVGNLDFSTFPSGPYKGLTGDSAAVQWLIDNEAVSMYYGGDATVNPGGNNNVVLFPMGRDVTYCPDIPFVAQYLGISAYNTISLETACYAAGTLGTPSCVGF
ncbi:Hypothetical protein HVR_LOCUS183 [uncultured virus]|nr:Hypothetical protein HVR_LOCUS183 [uncultured virus]